MDFNVVHAVVQSLWDGDTIHVSANATFEAERPWWPKIRFAHINAPELKNPDGTPNPEGQAALHFLGTLLKTGDKIILKMYGRDRDSRILADIWKKESDPKTINQIMLDSGHAVPMELKKQLVKPE